MVSLIYARVALATATDGTAGVMQENFNRLENEGVFRRIDRRTQALARAFAEAYLLAVQDKFDEARAVVAREKSETCAAGILPDKRRERLYFIQVSVTSARKDRPFREALFGALACRG